MSDLENAIQSLHEFKSCPVAEMAGCFSKMVELLRYLPNPEKKECAQALYQWADENKELEPFKLAYAELLQGLAYHLCDEHDTALVFSTKARTHFAGQNDRDGMALCAILQGQIYRTFGNFDLALKTLWEGYGGLKESGRYDFFLAACGVAMANINFEMNDYDGALLMFTNTYERCKKSDDFYFAVYALNGLGKVNMQQNKCAEAKAYFENALQLATERESSLLIVNSISELANFYLHGNDLDEAEKLSLLALSMREESKLTGGAISNCISLGEIYIRQKKWGEALRILNKGLLMAEQIKVKPKIYQVHFLLSQVYESENDLEKSLFHFKLFQRIQQQVEREDSARKLADAKLIFEAEQTQKENIIIKKQKEEIQNKNIQLQETIDELTITKVSRKARAITLVIAVILFVAEEPILAFALHTFGKDNYLLSLAIKMLIIFSLGPINSAIQTYLLKKVIRNKKKHVQIASHDFAIPVMPGNSD
jgi:tetratricopeptide (TPR) repeat protein